MNAIAVRLSLEVLTADRTAPLRNAFLDRTGLVWYDADLLWKQRGIEQLAIAVAWGVWERPLLPSIDYTEQLERFELLTGREAPRLSVRAE